MSTEMAVVVILSSMFLIGTLFWVLLSPVDDWADQDPTDDFDWTEAFSLDDVYTAELEAQMSARGYHLARPDWDTEA